MKALALLVAMQRVVGGVEAEHELLVRRRMRVEEQLHQQPRDSVRIVAMRLVGMLA